MSEYVINNLMAYSIPGRRRDVAQRGPATRVENKIP